MSKIPNQAEIDRIIGLCRDSGNEDEKLIALILSGSVAMSLTGDLQQTAMAFMAITKRFMDQYLARIREK